MMENWVSIIPTFHPFRHASVEIFLYLLEKEKLILVQL
jgi:hypothetical protein